MTAQDWKAKAAAAAAGDVVELTLPSGMVIRARRPGPMQFAAWDRLPMMLADAPGGAPSDEEALEIAGFLKELLIYCCVDPRVSLTPGPDEIAPRDIPEADWLYIVRWGMRLEEADAVRRFRGERADDGGGGDGKVVFLPAVGADGDRGFGSRAGIRPGGVPAGDRDGEGRG